MFVASLVAVLLAGSGLIAALVFIRDGDGSGDNGSEAGDCVVGTWRVVSYTEDSELGAAEMTEGEAIFTFAADGAGLADFGDGIVMEGGPFGLAQEARVTGQITYQYERSGQTLRFVQQDSQAEFSSDIDILGIGDDLRFTLPTGPLDYTCDGDTMDITGGGQAFAYQRVDS